VGWFKGLLLPWLCWPWFHGVLRPADAGSDAGDDGRGLHPGRPRQRGLLPLVALQHTGRATLSPNHHGLRPRPGRTPVRAIITESTFNIQGLGRLALTSVQQSDLSIMMATVLMGAVLILIAT